VAAETYDYIVVGAGSAGCVIATRLVESGARVLLLEAGPSDWHPLIRIPGGYAKLPPGQYRWTYDTEPQPEISNRRIPIPQGRVLGGSGSVNAMVYIRGQADDYNHWHALGNDGWAWADVLPWFKHAESNATFSEPLHGTAGPLPVSDVAPHHRLGATFVRAGQEIGLPFNYDFNGPSQVGVGYYQTTMSGGRRGSTARTYLNRLKRSHALKLKTDATVTRIVMRDGAASGVEYEARRQNCEARAGAGVVLAAGTFATPKLMMLSGLGAADQLAQFGIPLLRDLPGVGKNFQDHVSAPILANINEPISFLGEDQGWKALRHGLEWLLFKKGLLSSNVIESGGFLDLDGDGRADIQIHVIPIIRLDRVSDQVDRGGHGVTISSLNLRPRSRGTMSLRSRDPQDKLALFSNFLKDHEDVAIIVRGLRWIREILAAPSFRQIGASELLPGNIDTAAELEAYVRRTAKTAFHPVGTCRMGVDGDAVVDPTLKVRGIDKLWIGDASVMPEIVSGNTNAPTIMIAERAANFILKV
jgi:choline dehydrogenase-like flavoprotein